MARGGRDKGAQPGETENFEERKDEPKYARSLTSTLCARLASCIAFSIPTNCYPPFSRTSIPQQSGVADQQVFKKRAVHGSWRPGPGRETYHPQMTNVDSHGFLSRNRSGSTVNVLQSMVEAYAPNSLYIHANDPYSLLANLDPQKTHSCHASEDPERGLKYKTDPVLKPTAGPCQHPTQRQPLHLYAFFSCPSYSVVKKSSHRLEALGAIVADQQLLGAQIYQRCDLMILRNAKSPAALVAEGPAHWSRSLPEKFTSS